MLWNSLTSKPVSLRPCKRQGRWFEKSTPLVLKLHICVWCCWWPCRQLTQVRQSSHTLSFETTPPPPLSSTITSPTLPTEWYLAIIITAVTIYFNPQTRNIYNKHYHSLPSHWTTWCRTSITLTNYVRMGSTTTTTLLNDLSLEDEYIFL